MNADRLYNLLPMIYRLKDAGEHESLRALLAVIESELKTIELDIDALYDNWFIETCDEWVVPHIGELLGIDNLNDTPPAALQPPRPGGAHDRLPALEGHARDAGACRLGCDRLAVSWSSSSTAWR